MLIPVFWRPTWSCLSRGVKVESENPEQNYILGRLFRCKEMFTIRKKNENDVIKHTSVQF